MDGGGSVSYPQPSGQESALQAQQLGLLKQYQDVFTKQSDLAQTLTPALLGQAGIKPQYGITYNGQSFKQIGDNQYTRIGAPGTTVPQDVLTLDQITGANATSSQPSGPVDSAGRAVFNNGGRPVYADGSQVHDSAFESHGKLRDGVTLPDWDNGNGAAAPTKLGDITKGIVGYDTSPDPAMAAQNDLSSKILQGQLDQLTTQQQLLGDLRPQLQAAVDQQTKAGEINQQLLQQQLDDLHSPTQQHLRDLQDTLVTRAQAAASGNLPVDPGLLADLQTQENQLHDNLRRQLGPGYETSSPGIEALAQFEKNKNLAIEASRRGDIDTATKLGLGVGASNSTTLGAALGLSQGAGSAGYDSVLQALGLTGAGLQNAAGAAQLKNSGTSNTLGNLAGIFGLSTGSNAGLGNTLGAYSDILNSMANQRSMAYQGQLQAQQNRNASTAGLFQSLGTLGGFALAGPLGGAIAGTGSASGGLSKLLWG